MLGLNSTKSQHIARPMRTLYTPQVADANKTTTNKQTAQITVISITTTKAYSKLMPAVSLFSFFSSRHQIDEAVVRRIKSIFRLKLYSRLYPKNYEKLIYFAMGKASGTGGVPLESTAPTLRSVMWSITHCFHHFFPQEANVPSKANLAPCIDRSEQKCSSISWLMLYAI